MSNNGSASDAGSREVEDDGFVADHTSLALPMASKYRPRWSALLGRWAGLLSQVPWLVGFSWRNAHPRLSHAHAGPGIDAQGAH